MSYALIGRSCRVAGFFSLLKSEAGLSLSLDRPYKSTLLYSGIGDSAKDQDEYLYRQAGINSEFLNISAAYVPSKSSARKYSRHSELNVSDMI